MLKSTCYHSKYRLLPGPLLFNWNSPVLCLIPLLLCCLLIFVFCLFKIKTKALLLPSSSILGSGLPGRGWVPLSCAVGSLSSSPPGPRWHCSKHSGSQRCQKDHVVLLSLRDKSNVDSGWDFATCCTGSHVFGSLLKLGA